MEKWVFEQENKLVSWSRPITGFREHRGRYCTHLLSVPLPWGTSRVLQTVPMKNILTTNTSLSMSIKQIICPWRSNCCLGRQILQSKLGSWSSPKSALWEYTEKQKSTIDRQGSEKKRKHFNVYLSAGGIIWVLSPHNPDIPSCFFLAKQHMPNGKQQKSKSRGDIYCDFKVSGP